MSEGVCQCRTSGDLLLLGSTSPLSVLCASFWGALQPCRDSGAAFCKAFLQQQLQVFRSARGQLLLPCPWVLLSEEQITLLPTGSLAVAPEEQSHLFPKLQGCSQHRFLTYLPVRELGTERTWMQSGTADHPMPTPSLPRERMQESQAAGLFILTPKKQKGFLKIFEDGRQIYSKFWNYLHIFSTIYLEATLELWPKFLHSYTNHPPIRLLISIRIR